MSRINTNVSAITAQNNLGRSNADLQTSLTRLSTGLRINSGKDDPAGLIASETLRRDITAVDRAITNSQKAGQLIATADSALGQVSNLLNDIRGLVTEAANAGVLSAEQLAAQQLQVDSSLEAIDRIASSTTFQGRKILDGSLGFVLSEGTGYDAVSDLQIDQANLGATGTLAVNIDVSAAATKAKITNASPANATGQITFDNQTFTINTTAASGLDSVTVAVEKATGPEATGALTIDGHEFRITADSAQPSSFDDVKVDVVKDATSHAARANLTLDGTVIRLQADDDTTFDNTTVAVAKAALGATADATNVLIDDGGGNDTSLEIVATAGGAAAGDDPITIVVNETATVGGAADYDTATNTLTISLDQADAAISGADLKALIEGATVDGGAAGTQVFDVTANDLDTLDATAGAANLGATGDQTLIREDAIASYSPGTNTLTITLNSDLTNVTAAEIIAAVEAETGGNFNSDGNSGVVSGPSNIAVANVTASATYGTLARPSVLADFGTTTAGELTINLDSTNAAISYADIIAAIDGLAEFSGTTSTSSSGTINGITTAAANDAANLARIDGATASFNSSANTLTLRFDGSDTAVTAAEVIAAIDGVTEFENTTNTGSGTIDASAITASSNYATAGRVQDLVVRIAGELGSEVFSFQAGTTFQQIADAIQLVSDATGVTAAVSSGSLELTSTTYGSKGFVDVEVISEGSGGTFKSNLDASRVTGSDIVARVNGVQAKGEGNTLSINTSTLDVSLTVDEGSSADIEFTITGGGAVFQLGPDVVSNQQAQIGVQSIATGKLGGASGRLYELRSGGTRALASDITGAQRIVDETITEVVSLRGRLGAFQRTTLESNIASLQDTLVNLTDAESSIRDADFAKESAALTRAQILVQSGTSVLAIANQSPQNVLALLG